MKRRQATALIDELLRRAQGTGWPIDLVRTVYVFGSYARGALEPGNVDIAVDIDRTSARWRSHFIHSMSYGQDPYTVLRVALRGRRRSVSILFEPHSGHDDVPMTVLWQRGESLDTAIARLHAIQADSTARRAPRDAILPCFDGLDKWVPRYLRQELEALIKGQVITIEQVILADAEPHDLAIRDHINDRWVATSALRRAAHAALAYLESHKVDLHTVHLHSKDIAAPTTPHFVGFGLRHLSSALDCFRNYNGVQWLEVVHPTQKGPLHALQIRPNNRDKLSQLNPNPSSFFS
ncbi:hypothetical protein [Amycolatopsis sp. NPDC059021]|uniref:hypothetical protein n=1 Tax=Amycolatopsis sp. NPDC059021 TaxID=3346704 RepID=UPI00366FFD9B